MEGKSMSENNDFKEILKKIEKLEEGQRKLEKRFKKLQKDIINIQEDIYIDDDEDDSDDEYDDVMIYDDECEFEITCPYCGFEFIADDDAKGKENVKCPKCHKTIELDWDVCDEDCENCHQHENLNVAEKSDETYKNDGDKNTNNKPNQNNEDDM